MSEADLIAKIDDVLRRLDEIEFKIDRAIERTAPAIQTVIGGHNT